MVEERGRGKMAEEGRRWRVRRDQKKTVRVSILMIISDGLTN